VAQVIGTTDIDELALRLLALLPRLFHAGSASLLYLDTAREELRLLDAGGARQTQITEVRLSHARLESLTGVLRGPDPVVV
jgi:hypothetical protein